MQIDINADLGEGGNSDQALLGVISSANISCGAHAGDTATINAAISGALEHDVAIGAHPSYPDREGFGRRSMDLSPPRLRDEFLAQLDALQRLVNRQGGRLSHVKPHGALYNEAAADPEMARLLSSFVYEFDPALAMVGLAGSALPRAARQTGLRAVSEAFVDRAYCGDGTLVPRSDPRALLQDHEQALKQGLALTRGTATAVDGTRLKLRAETLCVHGDNPRALDFAIRLRRALNRDGIEVSRPSAHRHHWDALLR